MEKVSRKKPPINYHYRNIVRLTPKQHADLLSLCQEWGYTLSETTRKCLQIVSEMSMEERTAKVKDIQVEWGDDEYVNDRMGAMYHYGDCGNCGKTVSHNQKYCHECGARLEWE